MKYKIENEQDYIAFLHGKILFAADEVGSKAVAIAEDYLQRHHSVRDLEKYLEGLEACNNT